MIGRLIYIANVIPFAFIFLGPFLNRRYNFLFMNSLSPNRRTYYRQYWVRLFFGRAQYSIYTVMGVYYLVAIFFQRSVSNQILYLDFTAFTHDLEEFDEEFHPFGKTALIKFKHQKMLNNYKSKILDERSEIANRNRLEAIDKMIIEKNQL